MPIVTPHPLNPLDHMVTLSVCPQTIRGWVWYCDEHDTHGNADREGEAEAVARAHIDWWNEQLFATYPDEEDVTPEAWEELIDDMIENECEVYVWQRAGEAVDQVIPDLD